MSEFRVKAQGGTIQRSSPAALQRKCLLHKRSYRLLDIPSVGAYKEPKPSRRAVRPDFNIRS